MSALLAPCGAFLLAVLWMDLMFDVQVLRRRGEARALPEPVLASITGYYRHVTTTAQPMGHLVGAVMGVTLVALAVRIATAWPPRPADLASLVLAGGPILLALLRVYPNAVRLGARSDPPERQTALARAICRDHLLCFGGILAFVAFQVSGGCE